MEWYECGRRKTTHVLFSACDRLSSSQLPQFKCRMPLLAGACGLTNSATLYHQLTGTTTPLCLHSLIDSIPLQTFPTTFVSAYFWLASVLCSNYSACNRSARARGIQRSWFSPDVSIGLPCHRLLARRGKAMAPLRNASQASLRSSKTLWLILLAR